MAERPALCQVPAEVQQRFSQGEESVLDVHADLTVLVCDIVPIIQHLHYLPSHQLSRFVHDVPPHPPPLDPPVPHPLPSPLGRK